MPEAQHQTVRSGKTQDTRRVPLTELASPTLRKALDLWQLKRGSRRFPSRADIQPRDIAEYLRHVVLVRVLPGGEEFQFRVVGDAIVQAQGASFQGMTMAEIDRARPGYGAALRRAYRSVYRVSQPVLYQGSVVALLGDRAITHESLLLPLGEEERGIDHILLIAVYSIGS